MAAQSKTLTRKQRRTAAQENEIPMVRPDRSSPTSKTLYDLASERESELSAQADILNAARQSTKSSAGYAPKTGSATRNIETILTTDNDPPISTALLYASTLSMLFFTLSVLVHHQYGQSIPYKVLLQEAAFAFPVLTLLVYTAHSSIFAKDRVLGSKGRFSLIRQIGFCVAGALAGSWLVKIGNEEQYLAVMKRTPGLGVLWIWCVLEVGAGWAAGSVGSVALYAWHNGYGFW
ncbi:MAG: hypothetical protein M1828_005821 [Chrysothrix sp. TS-e1954]|nr:MAG: hypothetical protein M1828_005821 [Chrysothrix sp. TS-e1954]